MLIILLSIGLVILATEIFLWRLFRRKISDMHFPPLMDASSIRFFSVHRMRSAIMLHGGLLLLSTLIPLWLLW
ncbi:MAG: hypothetical protein Greene041662_332 [Candidatus Peregrinibacteria bacterium Greene0416_62]|nr:MAG: hypothetical protein Greene041662_332 [Candidatus Peregrinibacteria bacterium Greene0416_62]TSD00304.1 MAG: hypothetical protein Greene101449_238 [Candidatus Peregrinibacteria bacterium Greene1014_49]